MPEPKLRNPFKAISYSLIIYSQQWADYLPGWQFPSSSGDSIGDINQLAAGRLAVLDYAFQEQKLFLRGERGLRPPVKRFSLFVDQRITSFHDSSSFRELKQNAFLLKMGASPIVDFA